MPTAACRQTTVNLRSAAGFAVLGGSTVTNGGPTMVAGDLGLSPGTAITGFPPGIVVGTQHAGDPTAAQGIADPKRACIVGASYGGYAALAGVAIQSGIYRCAVAVAGVSDLASFMHWVARREEYGNKVGLRYWERFLGAADPSDKKLDAISPLKHADQITVPLMLIHGRDDVTVPYDQSNDIAKALKRAGKPAQFVTLDKEDHYLSRSTTRLQMLQSSIEFLRKYNPPD